ncbi:MAG TPA: hypothetical protein DIS79_06510 [Bacteroidetes bacterium]|nr:hypothetical protein [Bacteroidota bacterium]HRK04381.1 CAP domain-containing protein [Chlorobiota bacterium]
MLAEILVALLVTVFSIQEGSHAPIVRHRPDSLEANVVAVVNSVRSDPASFIPAVDRYERHVRSFTKDPTALRRAVLEVRTVLKKLKPLPPLIISDALQAAADLHALDIETYGTMGHIGHDGSDPSTRIAKFGRFTSYGENVTYGHMTAELIVASFLVDEGTPDRGHRKSLLAPNYTAIGVGIGSHVTYSRACVIVVGEP